MLRVEDDRARKWYMNEAANENWSTRQSDRQISTLYYERLLAIFFAVHDRHEKVLKSETELLE